MGATLTLLGHSSFLVKTDGGKTIYIDPWLDCPTCPESFKHRKKRSSSASPMATSTIRAVLSLFIKEILVRWRGRMN